MIYKENSENNIVVQGYKIHTFYFKFNPKNSYIFLLHGLRADTERMLPIIRLIQDKYNVISIDLPGFGKSKYDFNYENYIEFCSGLLEDIFIKLELIPEDTLLFGASNGANIIFEFLKNNKDKKNSKFKKVILFAPIYSNKNISMSKTYKRFVDFISTKTAKGGMISDIVQWGVDNDKVFNFFAKLFDKESSLNAEILDYEKKQYRLMSMKHWGKTLKHFLNIDYSNLDLKINNDNVIFIYPQTDQYLDIESTVNGFRRIFPNAIFKYFDSDKHMPRGDFLDDEKSSSSIKSIINEI